MHLRMPVNPSGMSWTRLSVSGSRSSRVGRVIDPRLSPWPRCFTAAGRRAPQLVLFRAGLVCRDDLLLDVGRDLVVVAEFHDVTALAAGDALEL